MRVKAVFARVLDGKTAGNLPEAGRLKQNPFRTVCILPIVCTPRAKSSRIAESQAFRELEGVFLQGTVPNARERRAIEDAVKRVPGAVDVRNDLRVR